MDALPPGKFSRCHPNMMLPATRTVFRFQPNLGFLAILLVVASWTPATVGNEPRGERTSEPGPVPSQPAAPEQAVGTAGDPTAAPLPDAHDPTRDTNSLDPADVQLLADAADGQLDDIAFLDAVLIANGIRTTPLSGELRRRFEGHVEVVRREVAGIHDPRQRCQAVHEWLHRHVLTGQYQADCTQISRALRQGDYNCVSATILFQLLCQACDVPTVAVATPTHVYARLALGPARTDVQTTCPDWFRMSNDQRRRFPRPSGGLTASPQPAGAQWSSWTLGEVREISDIQLLAKVYYNRGVRHLDARRFAEAEREFRTSLLLDADDRSAQENLFATLNNWALELAEKEEYPEASSVLNRGLCECPDYAPFQANDLHIHQKWALLLCRRALYGEALRILEAGQRRRPEVPLYRDGPQAVRRLWMKELVERRDYAGAWRIALGRARESAGPFPGRSDLESLVELAQQLAAGGRRVDALRLLDEGLRLQADSPLLRRIRAELNSGPF